MIKLDEEKLINPIFAIAVAVTLFVMVTLAVLMFIKISYGLEEDRYSTECGIYLLMTPTEYLEKTGKSFDFDIDSMPSNVHKQYVCVYKVYNQEKNTGINFEEIQNKADENLKELGQAMIRGND